jgi:hypothetical protein
MIAVLRPCRKGQRRWRFVLIGMGPPKECWTVPRGGTRTTSTPLFVAFFCALVRALLQISHVHRTRAGANAHVLRRTSRRQPQGRARRPVDTASAIRRPRCLRAMPKIRPIRTVHFATLSDDIAYYRFTVSDPWPHSLSVGLPLPWHSCSGKYDAIAWKIRSDDWWRNSLFFAFLPFCFKMS